MSDTPRDAAVFARPWTLRALLTASTIFVSFASSSSGKPHRCKPKRKASRVTVLSSLRPRIRLYICETRSDVRSNKPSSTFSRKSPTSSLKEFDRIRSKCQDFGLLPSWSDTCGICSASSRCCCAETRLHQKSACCSISSRRCCASTNSGVVGPTISEMAGIAKLSSSIPAPARLVGVGTHVAVFAGVCPSARADIGVSRLHWSSLLRSSMVKPNSRKSPLSRPTRSVAVLMPSRRNRK
mmetsp:Transcript_85977/g.263083  ORF Transcript_85977/g.263083 Transcript_85977/m.263083 type:complete len:239 (+) Transcript_85977:890-1606(+)